MFGDTFDAIGARDESSPVAPSASTLFQKTGDGLRWRDSHWHTTGFELKTCKRKTCRKKEGVVTPGNGTRGSKVESVIVLSENDTDLSTRHRPFAPIDFYPPRPSRQVHDRAGNRSYGLSRLYIMAFYILFLIVLSYKVS